MWSIEKATPGTERSIIQELAARTAEALATSATFGDAAVHAFRATSPASRVDLERLLRWLQTTAELPPTTQDDNFAQPAITVYRDDRFRIEVLFWTEQMVETCHSHVSDGAFCVLSGTRLHQVYELHGARDVTENLTLGALRMGPIEVLGPGDIRALTPGLDFIHSEWFNDPVSVSLGIRPHGIMKEKHDLFFPGIGWRMEHAATFLAEKRARILAVARLYGMALYRSVTAEMMAALDPYSAVVILRDAIDNALSAEHVTALAEAIVGSHACLADHLGPFVASYRRLRECVRLSRDADFDTRLVLGLVSSGCPPEELRTVFSAHRRAREVSNAAVHLQRLLADLAGRSRDFATYVRDVLV